MYYWLDIFSTIHLSELCYLFNDFSAAFEAIPGHHRGFGMLPLLSFQSGGDLTTSGSVTSTSVDYNQVDLIFLLFCRFPGKSSRWFFHYVVWHCFVTFALFSVQYMNGKLSRRAFNTWIIRFSTLLLKWNMKLWISYTDFQKNGNCICSSFKFYSAQYIESQTSCARIYTVKNTVRKHYVLFLHILWSYVRRSLWGTSLS